ncbi:MAG TPA: helix-turn-helix domain-containing protein [Acidimicrobiia bacterium]|nr:helix-turn-helix domain-containing protein [Acidimicrobiia bacterium]
MSGATRVRGEHDAVDRSVARAAARERVRAEREVAALVSAGLRVLRRQGMAACTVADVLAEAGLSTRAFYRHFTSKDELVLAIYAREAEASTERLAERIAATRSSRAAFEAWIDETLALGFDPRRARRTRVLAAEGKRLQAEFPEQFAAITDGVIGALRDILRAGRADGTFPTAHPDLDAASIHAVVWACVEARLRSVPLDRAETRAHVLRFCAPALGARP